MIEEKVKEMQTKLMKMKVFFKGGVHFHKNCENRKINFYRWGGVYFHKNSFSQNL